MVISKPSGSGGKVTVGTVAEQMLYEIGDGQRYMLPDVIADFSNVKMAEVEDGVHVSGALGRAPTDTYKISATYLDGYKATCVVSFVGGNAVKKAEVIADSVLQRTRRLLASKGIPDFEKTHLQVFGSESSFGAAAGTGGTPGITAVVGGRPKPSPCLKLYSFLQAKSSMPATVTVNGEQETYNCPAFESSPAPELTPPSSSLLKGSNTAKVNDLAFTRSGDKGNSCNIGVIARHPSYLPYLRDQLTEEVVAEQFKHCFEAPPVVRRYDLPGVNAMNFVLEASLGGGGIASLRPDPQGKAYGQILSDFVLTGLPTLEEMKKS